MDISKDSNIMFGVVKGPGTNLRSGGITVSWREASSIETKIYAINEFLKVYRMNSGFT